MLFSDDLEAQEPKAVEVGADGEGRHLQQEQDLQATPKSEAIAKTILDEIIEAMFGDQDSQPVPRTIAQMIIDDIIEAMFDNNNNTGNLTLWWIQQLV